nr:hypothetical protein [Tanacetum cinerariifolium]
MMLIRYVEQPESTYQGLGTLRRTSKPKLEILAMKLGCELGTSSQSESYTSMPSAWKSVLVVTVKAHGPKSILSLVFAKILMLEMFVDESLEMIVDDSLDMIEDESLDMIVDESLMVKDKSLEKLVDETLKLDEEHCESVITDCKLSQS